MGSGKAGRPKGTQDAPPKAHPQQQLQQPPCPHQRGAEGGGGGGGVVSFTPQPHHGRDLPEQGPETARPGVDADGDIEVDGDLDGDDEGDDDDDDEEGAQSVYAMSMYPGVRPAYQVEHPYESGHDSATIDSARTLYAEDFDFVVEHGRQYCGDYFLPIDQTEQTRQYVIHQVYLKLFNLELSTVPLDNPRYILDIGTGIGEWAIGMAEKYPHCEVFGTDIAPIQPTHQVPFNIEFHIENAEDEWIRPADTVDLVHIRNMEGAFADWSFVYSQAYACIKPGGWIEVIDWEDFFADANYASFFPEGSAPRVLISAVLEAAERAGKPRDSRHLSADLLVDAGFVDIRETVYDLGIGSRENASYGKFWLFSIVTGVEASCLRLLTKYLGWDAGDVRELCERVAQETKAVADDLERVGAFVVKLRVVAGRRPAVPGQWTARELGENGEVKELSGDESTIGGRTIRSEETA